jgi:AbrB family looped-hinge helix DNA binding protein
MTAGIAPLFHLITTVNQDVLSYLKSGQSAPQPGHSIYTVNEVFIIIFTYLYFFAKIKMLNTNKGAPYPMEKTAGNNRTVAEYTRIPVSSQGQITLPKPLREKLGIKSGSTARLNFVLKADGTITVEPTPSADSLFGILGAEAKAKQISPVNAYDVREEIGDERLRELGYTPQDH